jgi:predicted cobalt transporter CbtA
MRDLWAFLVGDWHRSRVIGTALVGAYVGAFGLCVAASFAASEAGAHDAAFWPGLAAFALFALAPMAHMLPDVVSESIRKSAREGRRIIRAREQARREAGQLSVREQGGEISEVPQ